VQNNIWSFVKCIVSQLFQFQQLKLEVLVQKLECIAQNLKNVFVKQYSVHFIQAQKVKDKQIFQLSDVSLYSIHKWKLDFNFIFTAEMRKNPITSSKVNSINGSCSILQK